MKRNKKCPKCNGKNIKVISPPPYSGLLEGIQLNMGLYSTYFKNFIYLCITCGYTEIYADVENLTDKMKDKIDKAKNFKNINDIKKPVSSGELSIAEDSGKLSLNKGQK